MTENEPKRVIIESGDGAATEVEFEKLSGPVQMELRERANFPVPTGRKYVLLQWKDGWCEVMAVDEECSDLFRYYVLRRMEEHGRLGIARSGPYPAVKIIGRKPDGLAWVAFTDGKDSRTYALSETKDIREEGGKTEIQYNLESIASNPLKEILESLKQALNNQGVKAEGLIAEEHLKRLQVYERLLREINVKPYERQEDVLAFIDVLLRELAKA